MGHNFRVLKWLHYIAKLEKNRIVFPLVSQKTQYHQLSRYSRPITLVTRLHEIPKLIQLRVLS